MEFKEKLKIKRKELNMTQQEVADGIGVSRSVVAKWETGLVIPKEDTMVSLANLLNVEVSDLYSDNTINKKKINVSLIILGLVFVFIVLDVFDLLAMIYEFRIVTYIVLISSFIFSFIKIPYRKIISICLSVAAFLLVIITHIYLCFNPYTFYYEEIDGGIKITDCKYNIDSYYKKIYLEIPSYIDNKQVKIIGEDAFSNKKIFDVLRLPSTIEKIEDAAFYNTDIKELYFENGIKYLGRYAFKGNEISYVKLPSSVDYLDASFDRDVIIVVESEKIDYVNYIGNKTYYDSVFLKEIDNVYYV